MDQIKNPVVIPIIIPANSMLRTYNCYLIKGNDTLTLVDAAIDDDEAYQIFLDVLEENNLQVKDLSEIVLTHNHSDHTGFVRRIREQTDVNVFAHPKAHLRLMRDENFLTKRINFFDQLYKNHGCGKRGIAEIERMKEALTKNYHLRVDPPIYPLVEGDMINDFKVLETPGHSIDQIVLYNEASGELIAGDHILEHAPSNALIEMGMEGEMLQSLYLYEQSLKRCETLYLTTIYPGHGIVVREDCNELFTKRLNSINRKSKRIKAEIIKKDQSASELAKSHYKEMYDTLFVLVMSEEIGHLERLVINNELTKTYKNSVYIYSAKE